MVQRKVMEVISVSHKLMLSVYEFEFETVPVFFPVLRLVSRVFQ